MLGHKEGGNTHDKWFTFLRNQNMIRRNQKGVCELERRVESDYRQERGSQRKQELK